jgi:hypothetical protein
VLVEAPCANGTLQRVEAALVGEIALENNAGNPYRGLQIEIEAGDIRRLPAVVRATADVDETGENRGLARDAASCQAATRVVQVFSRPLLDPWVNASSI